MLYYFYTLTSSDDPENIRYVGVTTNKLTQRLSGHRYNAIYPNKRSQPVHKWMWNKIQNKCDICITQIDCCEENLWESIERKWIQYYRELGYDLLNVSEGGSGVITKDMRTKNGIQRSIDAHKKAIYALDMKTLEIVKEYSSIVEATKDLGLRSKSAIGNALNPKSKTASSGGYYWAFKEEYDNGNFTLKFKNPYPHGKTGSVYQFDLQGNLINTYYGVQDACYKLNVKNGTPLNKSIKDKRMYKNSYWSFNEKIDISEFKGVFNYVETDPFGNIIAYYKTGKEIANKYEISPVQVSVRIKNYELFGGNFIKKL